MTSFFILNMTSVTLSQGGGTIFFWGGEIFFINFGEIYKRRSHENAVNYYLGFIAFG